jgi:hypothetical protein
LIGHRTGGRRGAEERAAESRSLFVGPVHEPHCYGRLPQLGDAAENLDAGRDVQGTVEPAAVRNRVDVPADQHDAVRRAGQREPLVARSIDRLVGAGIGHL